MHAVDIDTVWLRRHSANMDLNCSVHRRPAGGATILPRYTSHFPAFNATISTTA